MIVKSKEALGWSLTLSQYMYRHIDHCRMIDDVLGIGHPSVQVSTGK